MFYNILLNYMQYAKSNLPQTNFLASFRFMLYKEYKLQVGILIPGETSVHLFLKKVITLEFYVTVGRKFEINRQFYHQCSAQDE